MESRSGMSRVEICSRRPIFTDSVQTRSRELDNAGVSGSPHQLRVRCPPHVTNRALGADRGRLSTHIPTACALCDTSMSCQPGDDDGAVRSGPFLAGLQPHRDQTLLR